MTMTSPPDLTIVLYHYPASIYSRRLIWYLNLRKIPYAECIQPYVMPRPDLSRLLGVSYRRMPVLSIGRDVYLDTRLIIQKLEVLFPPSSGHPGISSAHALITSSSSSESEIEGEKLSKAQAKARAAEHTALEQLLSHRTIDGDVFARGAQCFSVSAAKDEAFVRDRADLVGVDMSKPGARSPFSAEVLAAQIPEARAAVARWVRWLEDGLLADGRRWILDSNSSSNNNSNDDETGAGPSLADLEAVWVLHWIRDALPTEILGPESAPRVHAWIDRFDEAVKRASALASPRRISGGEAAKLITGSPSAEPGLDADDTSRRRFDSVVEAEGLVKGVHVKLWPSDYGSLHKDRGALVLINDLEIVVDAKGGPHGSVRIHAPRHGFKVTRDISFGVSSSL